MRDDDYLRILRCGNAEIVIAPQPPPVSDVDPVIIADMKARLAGKDQASIHERGERTIDELALRRERQKLQQLFKTPQQLRQAFSSLQNIGEIQKELCYTKINKSLLADYCYLKAGEANVDEMDFYRAFLFGSRLLTKQERLSRCSRHLAHDDIFRPVLTNYEATHFDFLRLSRDVIQPHATLRQLFKTRQLAQKFDTFLNRFYGWWV